MIHLECPGCRETVAVEDRQAGKSAACPNCGTKFRVPGEAVEPERPAPKSTNEQVEVTPCPGCQARIAVARVDLGTVVECPYCVTQFVANAAERGDRPSRRRKPPSDAGDRRDKPTRLSRRQEDDDDRDDDDEEDRPRRRRKAYDDGVPSNVKTVGVLMLIGGIYALLQSAGMALGTYCVCLAWPGLWLAVVWGILGIIRGSAMMNGRDPSPTPPTVLLTLQILLILNCDILNMILGIVGLSMANNAEVQDYYAANDDY
jgi:ribosomal protein L37AE/L43A